jgi:hypothetical protein
VNNEYEIDLCKYRINSIKWFDLLGRYWKYYQVNKEKMRMMLCNLGVVIPEGEDPEIFFIVRKEDYDNAKVVCNKGRKKPTGNSMVDFCNGAKAIEPDAAMLFGISPSIALTHDMAKHRFELAVQNYNERKK